MLVLKMKNDRRCLMFPSDPGHLDRPTHKIQVTNTWTQINKPTNKYIYFYYSFIVLTMVTLNPQNCCIDRSPRQKQNIEIIKLTEVMKKIDLTDIFTDYVTKAKKNVTSQNFTEHCSKLNWLTSKLYQIQYDWNNPLLSDHQVLNLNFNNNTNGRSLQTHRN